MDEIEHEVERLLGSADKGATVHICGVPNCVGPLFTRDGVSWFTAFDDERTFAIDRRGAAAYLRNWLGAGWTILFEEH